MLGKLIKHEFRATGRIMWPLFLGMAALAVFLHTSGLLFASLAGQSWTFTLLNILLTIGFGLGMAGILLAPPVLSAVRFRDHILREEGYLTLTLPVSTNQLLAAKLIVSAVWYTLAAAAFVLLLLYSVMDLGEFLRVFDGIPAFFRELRELDAVKVAHGAAVFAQLFLNWVAGVTLISLAVYAAYAIGYSGRKHKSLRTTLLTLFFLNLLPYVGVAGLVELGKLIKSPAAGGFLPWMAVVEKLLAGALGGELVLGAVFYALTSHFINKRLNLE